ncbi:MAG: hypothetical protein ACLFT7_05280 [Thermoplasmata archaeon]
MQWEPFELHEDIEVAKGEMIARGSLEDFKDYLNLRYNKSIEREIPNTRLHPLTRIEIFGSCINAGLLKDVLKDSERYECTFQGLNDIAVIFKGSDKRKQPVLIEDYDRHYAICPIYTNFPPILVRDDWRSFISRYFEKPGIGQVKA